MKKYMKKIIVGILSFAFLFIGQSSFAAVSSVQWNGDPSDCHTIAVANYSTSIGIVDPCWPLSSVSAEADETINVRIYYHNTGNSTATNTRIILNAPTGISSRQTFTGQIVSDQASLSFGPVTANIPSGQSLIFGSARWYPNQTQTGGQVVSGITSSSGASIGSIASGWNSQGSVVVSFKVSSTTPPVSCAINSFTANPTSITYGQSTTLNWNTSGCRSANIQTTTDNGSSVDTSGSKTYSPEVTTTYTLVATASDYTDKRQSLTVTVGLPPASCAINSFTTSPTSITSGDSSTLAWSTSNCTNVTISNLGYSVPTSGSQAVWPTVTTTYVLTATGTTGAAQTRNTTVSVNDVVPVCAINSFTASPTSITSGDSSTLAWSTSNCTKANIQTSVGSVATSGSTTVYPTQTTTYVLHVNGTDWVDKTRSVTVNVTPKIVSQMTGSITAGYASCVISSGASTCPIPFHWSTQNPIGTSSITNNNRTVATGNNSDGTQSQSFPVSYGPQTFYLYNSTILLDQATVNASCASGTSWNSSSCATIVNNICQDPSASNYRGSLPCIYLCKDTSASNYNGALPCTYPQLCKDTSASNYNGTLPCTYSQQFCKDTSASNYNGALPCTYPQLCKDTSASNYNGALPCTYPQICRDASASNYLGALPCTYPPQLCKDTSASNYNGALPCTYPSRICEDHTANNYGGALPCTYPPQLCKDTSASNYNGALPCTYPPQLCQDPTANNYRGALPCTYPQPVYCSINTFTANPTSITDGDSSTLNWNTSNCVNVTISNLGYLVPTSGAQVIWPTQTTTYTLTATSSNGVTRTDTATVYVNDVVSNCSITSFTASDTSINDGDYTTLKWNTNNCVRVKISDIGNVSEDGSKKVYPTDDTTYVLTAYDSNGATRTKQVTIYVDNNNNSDCSIDSFTANNTYINGGDPVTLRWSTSLCDNVSISNIGNVSLDGSRVVYPLSSITYVLRADNSESRSIQVNVGNQIPTQLYNTNVVTTVATNISQTGAQVNGLITSSNYTNANVYFEYGTTVNLGSRTVARPTSGNTNFSESVSSLSPNTIYYFQAFATSPNGISRGAIEVFKTLGYNTNYNTNTNTNTVQTVRQVVVQGPTVYGSQSPLILRIENRYQMIGVGDIIDYTVYYKNISSSTLTHPMVQVFIPQGITLTNSSRGTYSESDKTLSVPIEDLIPDAEGVIYLQARVDSINANLAQIVTTAILVYTNPNGAQENAMAYVLNNPRIVNGNLLGASAFFGNFLGFGLLGWLLLLILILLIILIARSYYMNRRNTTTTKTEKTISQ